MMVTKAQRKALLWFSQREHAHLFGAGDPTLTMVKKLKALGYIEDAGLHMAGRLPFSLYRISDAGRAVIAARETQP